jgi:pyrimidine operon attenuation protein/uracil phosphoribosyltransferase
MPFNPVVQLPARADYVDMNLSAAARSRRVQIRLEEIDGLDRLTVEEVGV